MSDGFLRSLPNRLGSFSAIAFSWGRHSAETPQMPTCKNAGSPASFARSISCHALPSPSIQRCAYHAGASCGGAAGASSTMLRNPRTCCTTIPAFISPTPRAKEHQPALSAAEPGVAAQEGGKVDDGKEVAANVGNPEIPRPGQRHRHHVRQRRDLACVGQPDQPALAAAGQAPAATTPPARWSWSPDATRVPAGTCGDRVLRCVPWM